MIIPSIDILDGRAVQLEGGDPGKLRIDAGDPMSIAEKFALIGEITVIDLDAAMGSGSNASIIRKIVRRFPCRVGGGIRSLETARQWLDAGATTIILGTAAHPELLSQLPRNRVMAALDARYGKVVIEGWKTSTDRGIIERIDELRNYVGGFLVTFVEREGRMAGTDFALARNIVNAAEDVRVTIAGGVTSASEVRDLDDLGADAQIGMALYSGRLDMADALAAILRSDRADGLWPTIVCDEAGKALGLAYSNRESLDVAIRSARGTYYSRSRQSLWTKGETSGNTQRLIRVDLDCDRDALRFTVQQHGDDFCHRQTRTCFGEDSGLHTLMRRISAPEASRDQGSYTSRLMRDPELLADKIREEADELCEATASDQVVAEAADVLYFTLCKLASAGQSITDVERELDRRSLKVSRRAGEAKNVTGNSVHSRMKTPCIDDSSILREITIDELPKRRRVALDDQTMRCAARIVEDVRMGGLDAARRHAIRLGDIAPGDSVIYEPSALRASVDAISKEERDVLERTAQRISSFARAQRNSLKSLTHDIPGGQVGHDIVPLEAAGCYAPGGRFPLISSVLMTAVTARVAGVKNVWLASPKPAPAVLAAAAIADVDGLVALGGAQAIALLAFGADMVPAGDIVVGPGNRFVTAAKQLIAGHTAIDMLAGPSELLIIADATADPKIIAADLLAQAEHDIDARVWLVTDHADLIATVRTEVERQLKELTTRSTARSSLAQSGTIMVKNVREAIQVSDSIAPEHLQIMTQDGQRIAAECRHYGAVFIGSFTAQVLGDYGIGPNHTLPTSGSARNRAGLSVLDFLRTPTWARVDDPTAAAVLEQDAVFLAQMEGLHGHAAALLQRRAVGVNRVR